MSRPVPPAVAKAVKSSPTKAVLTSERHGGPLWLVWHRWTERDSQTGNSWTVDSTRYFVPTRDEGTGDAAFDKTYLIRSGDTSRAAALVGPPLREGLLENRLPPWRVSGGVLIVPFHGEPAASNLEPRAVTTLRIAELLR